ncbi:MAG TPA: NAD-dependent epimerase/dehydratase family protein [Chitinophagaceae bacterium]|nr:NAD-dependent epimerase/dehydratase family protein [Chitinophagaceae bacterium]
MKVFITGATGYIGHQLAREAVTRGHTAHILVRDLNAQYIPVDPNIVVFRGDVTDKDSILMAMKGCDSVLHAAGITKFRVRDNSIFYKVNVEGTRNVLDAALILGIKKFVFTSSGAVIGPSGKHPMSESDPRVIAFENDYEISKHWAEQLVKEYNARGLCAMTVAVSRVYGPGIATDGNVVSKMLSKMLSAGIAFVPTKGDKVANYVFIDDVVSGHFLALERGTCGEKYIIGGENISYNTFFQYVREHAPKKIRVIRTPKALLVAWSFLHMLVYGITGRQTNISPRTIRRAFQNRALTSEKAISQLGYTITPFSEGIRATILHLQNKQYGH